MPVALVLSGGTLYGVAEGGGTVFSLNTNGTGFKSVYTFTNGTDGGELVAGLVLSGNTLMGQRIMVAARAVARCSPSTPMAPVLPTCIVLQQPHLLILIPTAMEAIRKPV